MAALLSGTAVLQGSRSTATTRRRQLSKDPRSLVGSSTNQADSRMINHSLEADSDASDSNDASEFEKAGSSLQDHSL